MKFIRGISEITNDYDNFIIDLWGVLHDGYSPYNGAVEALKQLKDAGRKIVLLSNAPRRSYKAKTVLDNLGFTENMYDHLITSGEACHEYVKKNKATLGERYIYIGPEKDRDLLNDLGLKEVPSATDADFALATGFEGFGSLFSEKQHQLDEALAAQIPVIIANPDKKVVKQTGEEYICAGLMGEYCAQKGGKVIYFGKPHGQVYIECLKFFGTDDVRRLLCIGDSLHTDIAGANNIKADSLFICGGIHRQDIYLNNEIDKARIEKLIETEGQTPTYFINEFSW